MRKKIVCATSGGRTSAVMTKLINEQYENTHDIVNVFANTGCEHENTLKFVDQCDKHFGWNIVWLEADVQDEEGVGTKHKVVNYETASRNGKPMEAVIAKYGLPSPGYLHCTRETKDNPIKSYLKNELDWGEYKIAIGIRSDEIDRAKFNQSRFIYPLVKAGWTKQDVKDECASWPFDLKLVGEHWGNCVWCWKKSLRKLLTLAKEDESVFDFPKRMEENYKDIKPYPDGSPKFIFRQMMRVPDIVELARTRNFEPYQDIDQTQMFSQANYDVDLDVGGGCGESCEPFIGEN